MSSTAYCVYQCNKCNNIVCDSLCNILIDQDLKIITSDSITFLIDYFVEAVNVTVLGKTKLINDGPAEGATYLELQCDSCKETIGMTFKSTTAETDIYRNMFSFYMDKIKVYTIGSCTLSRKENVTESEGEIHQGI